MKISYNEACALGCSTLEQDLVLCEKAGFDFIEIRLDMLTRYLMDHRVDDLVSFFASNHIKPHAFNALYLYEGFLSPSDDTKRGTFLLSEFLLACQIGEKIGDHDMIVVPPFREGPNYIPYPKSEEETFDDCVRMLRLLAPIAEDYGIKLSFELVGFPRSSVRTIKAADRIVRAVNEPNVGFVFDAYNIFLYNGQNDFKAIKEVQPEKIFSVHLNSADDVPENERGQDKRCFPGEGIVDVDDFLKKLKGCGYNGMVSIETFRPSHWQQSPEWVIDNAYATTRASMERNGCLEEDA